MNLFLDTGAGVSLVNSRFISQANLSKDVQTTSTLISGLGKTIIPVRGEIKLPVQMSGCTTEHLFIVCDNLENEFLIGIDLLNKIGAKIDLPNKKLLTKYGETDFITKPVKINKRIKIRCHKNIKVPANSSGYLKCKIPVQNKNENYEGVVDPYRKLSTGKGVFVTGSISYSQKNIMHVHYVNVTPDDVTIFRNQLVGFLEPMECSNLIQGVNTIVKESEKYDATIDIPRLEDAASVEKTIADGMWPNPEELHKRLGIEEMQIPQDYKSKLKDLITEYSHCFAKDRFDLGEASHYKAKIHLKRDWEAKWVPSRPIAYKLESEMDEQIDNMIRTGQITRCTYSLWNSAVFLVGKPKAEGGFKYRFVQDARALNSQTVQDSYELPRVNNILDRMSDCKWLSNLDFQSSFTQIGLEESSQPLTAFTYKGSRYQWKRLVMGTKSASAEWSRALQMLFTKVPFESLVLYVDDMLLWSIDEESHLKKLRFVLERLEWGNLKLNPEKTRLFQKECSFLGRKISQSGIRLDDDKVKAIQALPPPTSVKEVQKVLGALNWNRQHIKHFASLASPLYNLLQKGRKFEWTKECQESFESLKKALTTSPVLSLPDLEDKNQSFQVVVDSSKRGQGATLTQEIGGERRTIAYWSRAVPLYQRNLGATRLELIALHGALKHWRLWLTGTKFLVLSDCRALLSLTKIFKNENSYFQRRLADLAAFNFEIKHVSGSSTDMKMADFLSRYSYERRSKEAETQTLDTTQINHENRVAKVLTMVDSNKRKPVTLEEIKDHYHNDRTLTEVIGWINDGEKPNEFNPRNRPKELYHYWKNFNLLKLKDGILYRSWYDTKTEINCQLIIVPCTLVERVLYMYHDTIAECHAGVKACVEKCLQKFYFYKLEKEFKLYIGSCIECARTKQPKAYFKAALSPIVYTEFNQAVSIDHLEPSKTPTPRGNVALLTICDMFTNYMVVVPVKSVGTEASVSAILENWILKFGVPEVIAHDLGTGFTSHLWKAIMSAFGIKDVKTTPKFSQANGKAEACNKKLNQCFRVTLNEKEWKNYDVYVKYITFCLNNLVCTRTGFSPHFLVYGFHPRMPRDLVMKNDNRLEETLMKREDIEDKAKRYAYQLHKKIGNITRKARASTEQKIKYMKNQYDKSIKNHVFQPGDMCFLLELWPKHKHSKKFRGPYKIIKKITDHNYLVDIDGHHKVVNISKMKVYTPNKYSKDEYVSQKPVTEKSDGYKDNTSGRKMTKEPKRPSSDSSDDDILITFNQPVKKRRSPRLMTRSNTTLPSKEKRTVSEPECLSTSHVSESGATDQDTKALSEKSETTDFGATALTETSDQDFTDALEALDDANQSMEAAKEQSKITPATRDGDTNPSTQSRPEFPCIDTHFTLSDIEGHSSHWSKMQNIADKHRDKAVLPSTTDTLVDKKSKLQKSNENTSGNTERYNLRKAPKKVTKFDASESDCTEKPKKSSKLKIKSPLKKKK